MISVQIIGPYSVGFLTKIFSSFTKIQIYKNDCTSINKERTLTGGSNNLESPLQKNSVEQSPKDLNFYPNSKTALPGYSIRMPHTKQHTVAFSNDLV